MSFKESKMTMPVSFNKHRRLRRIFFEGFTAMDLAEPLVSFDADSDAAKTRKYLIDMDFDLVGIRKNGLVCGFARQEDLVSGYCGGSSIFFFK